MLPGGSILSLDPVIFFFNITKGALIILLILEFWDEEINQMCTT